MCSQLRSAAYLCRLPCSYTLQEPAAKGDAAASSSGAAAAPAAAPSVELELRIVSRDGAGTVLYRELLPAKGLAVAASSAPASSPTAASAAPANPGAQRPALPGELHLLCDADEVTGHEALPILFVVTPCDIVVAQPRGPLDHAEWELRHGRPANAVAIALAHPADVSAERRAHYTATFIGDLLKAGEMQRAADACAALLSDDAVAWDSWLGRVMHDADAAAGALPEPPAMLTVSTTSSAIASSAASASPTVPSLGQEALALTPASRLEGAWHFARAALLRHLIDVGAPPLLSPTSGVALRDASRAVALLPPGKQRGRAASTIRPADGSGSAGAEAPAPTPVRLPALTVARCTQVLEFLCRHDPLTFVLALRAVQASARRGDSAAPFASSGASAAGSGLLFDSSRLAAAADAGLRATQAALQKLCSEGSGAASSKAAAGADATASDAEPSVEATRAAARCGALLEASLDLLLGAGRLVDAITMLLAQQRAVRDHDDGSDSAQSAALDTAAAGDRDDDLGDDAPGSGAKPPAAAFPPPQQLPPGPARSLLAAAVAAVSARFADRLFDAIEGSRLHSAVAERVPELLAVSEPRSLRLLAAGLASGDFALERIALQLSTAPLQSTLLRVLDHLLAEVPDQYDLPSHAPFLDVHAQLCAQLDRQRLLPFLQRCQNYTPDAAIDACSRSDPPAHVELAYLHVRAKRPADAIAVQVGVLGDVPSAIATAQQFNTPAAWEAAVAATLARATAAGRARDDAAALVDALLEGVSGSGGCPLSVLDVIARVPPALPVPRLHERLAATIRERRMHATMWATCAGQVKRDLSLLSLRRHVVARNGMALAPNPTCQLCMAPLAKARSAAASSAHHQHADADAAAAADGADGDEAAAEAVATAAEEAAARAREAEDASKSVLFFCRHAFHYPCLREYQAKAIAEAATAAAAAERAATRGRSLSRVSSGGDLAGGGAGAGVGGGRRRRGSSFSVAGGGGGGSSDNSSFDRAPGRGFAAPTPRRSGAAGSGGGGGSRDGSGGGGVPGSAFKPRRGSMSLSRRMSSAGTGSSVDTDDESSVGSGAQHTSSSVTATALGGVKASQWACPLCSGGAASGLSPSAAGAAAAAAVPGIIAL